MELAARETLETRTGSAAAVKHEQERRTLDALGRNVEPVGTLSPAVLEGTACGREWSSEPTPDIQAVRRLRAFGALRTLGRAEKGCEQQYDRSENRHAQAPERGSSTICRMSASDHKARPAGTVDFGFEQVARADKARRVRGVFDSVADRYDLMNDLMSGGLHRLWKHFVLTLTGLRPGQRALDVAGGTGDLSVGLARQVGDSGFLVLSDINAAMLARGRTRLTDAGVVGNVAYALADAERLPFADSEFDCITIGFGLRNVTDKAAALASMYRVLRPGGQLLILEFSHPTAPGLKPLYDAYSFRVLPVLGRLVANDADSYRYLAESIRMHPEQEALLAMMRKAGFEGARYHNLTGGIVAVHRGYRW